MSNFYLILFILHKKVKNLKIIFNLNPYKKKLLEHNFLSILMYHYFKITIIDAITAILNCFITIEAFFNAIVIKAKNAITCAILLIKLSILPFITIYTTITFFSIAIQAKKLTKLKFNQE